MTASDKGHREFFAVPEPGADLDGVAWQRVTGSPGITELVLSDSFDDARRTGSRTRLTHWEPGTLLPDPVRHDYREEILVLSGDLVVGCAADGTGGQAFVAYAFATRPAGIWHGPFTTRTGCVMLELDIYE